MKRIKVILIQGLLAPYRYPIFEELSVNSGWDFEVWFMGKSVKNRIWSEEELSYYSFKRRFLNGATFNVGVNDNYPFWFNPMVGYEIVKNKPDVLIMYGWDSITSFLAHITCKILGIKFVLYSDSTANETSWRRILTFPIVKAHVILSDGLIAGGTLAKSYFEKIGASQNNIEVSYNSVDVKRYHDSVQIFANHKDKIKKSLKIKGPVIMYYGQLIKRKGVDILVKAFGVVGERHKNLTLLIVGDGPEDGSLKKLAKKSGFNRIIFIPNPGDRLICKYYAISDIFVLPSKEEVWGLVVNEAMSSGLPVIVSDISGSSKDLIRNGLTGYTFKSGNVNDLVEKIDLLLSDESKRRKIGSNAYELIKKYDFINASEGYLKIVDKLIPQKKKLKQNFSVNFKYKEKKDLLSIIIPVKNDLEGLKLTLHSISSNQTKNDYEIIVINDGLSKNISELCLELGVSMTGASTVKGSYYSRNLGIGVSSGMYLAFVDAGTCVSGDWIDVGLNNLKSYEYVGGPVEIVNNSKVNSFVYRYEQLCEFPVKYFMEHLHFSPTTNLFIKRKVIERCGGFDNRLFSSGDLEFGRRVFELGVDQSYANNLMVFHPARSYVELFVKHARLAVGSVQLKMYHSDRFQILNNVLFYLLKSIIPPFWLFNLTDFSKLNFFDKLLLFFTAFHFSSITNLWGAYYTTVLPRQHAKSRA